MPIIFFKESCTRWPRPSTSGWKKRTLAHFLTSLASRLEYFQKFVSPGGFNTNECQIFLDVADLTHSNERCCHPWNGTSKLQCESGVLGHPPCLAHVRGQIPGELPLEQSCAGYKRDPQ